MNGINSFAKRYWDEGSVYIFTVACVFLGDYILHGTRPEKGWLPFVASLVVAVVICLAVEVMTGVADTDAKRTAKRRNLPKRFLFSGLAGISSQAVIPVLLKSFLASIGIEV